MQHYQQRTSADVILTWNVELVVSPSGSAGIGAAQELSTVGDLQGFPRPDARQSIEAQTWKLGPIECRGNVTNLPRRRPPLRCPCNRGRSDIWSDIDHRSEEHTSELQSLRHLVC